MTAWDTWASGVFVGLGAPGDSVNVDTLWAWSGAESGDSRMRWNNPLNTTYRMAGSTSANSVGVQIYVDIADGINATVATLLNGRYPTIVSHLRNSVPRSQWGDACGELGTWGTGCGWITYKYSAYLGTLTGDQMTAAQESTLNAIYAILAGSRINGPAVDAELVADTATLKQIHDAIAALVAPAPDLSALQTQVNAIQATVERIENALRAA